MEIERMKMTNETEMCEQQNKGKELEIKNFRDMTDLKDSDNKK